MHCLVSSILHFSAGHISYLSRFSNVFFIDASTKETIIADLTNIALFQQIGESEKDTLDWFSTQHEEWLLVFDNADDPGLNLRLYLPRCSHGNILITSRNGKTCFHGPQSCHVSDMSPKDARDLLLKIAHLEHNNENEALATAIVKVTLVILVWRVNAITIVQELGHLALAVVQAGAYIFRSGCGIRLYLQLYQSRRGDLLEEYSKYKQKINNYEWTVYMTW